jgi:DNA-binding transcriptional MerR regulator
MNFPNSNKQIELFYISTLAYELGRTTNTVRKWEIAGIIPPTLFKDSSKRRLYSREQIDIIVQCAIDAKIKQGASLNGTSFESKVHKRLAKLNEQYIKELKQSE